MTTGKISRIPRLSRLTTRFEEDLAGMIDQNELRQAMSKVTRELGFDVFVLGQLPSVSYDVSNFVITNYPDAWRDAVYSRFMFGDDPVIDALSDAVAPFLWEDLAGYRNPTARQRAYLDAAFSYGLSKGYAVPIKAPGQPIGVVSFATVNNGDVDRSVLPFTSYVATAAYRRALQLVAETRSSQQPQVPLTDQEVEWLKCAARGLSNLMTERRMRLSALDQSELRKSVFAKLGYSNKVQAVARALQLGLVTYNDAFLS